MLSDELVSDTFPVAALILLPLGFIVHLFVENVLA
jgi:hypothetical protein